MITDKHMNYFNDNSTLIVSINIVPGSISTTEKNIVRKVTVTCK